MGDGDMDDLEREMLEWIVDRISTTLHRSRPGLGKRGSESKFGQQVGSLERRWGDDTPEISLIIHTPKSWTDFKVTVSPWSEWHDVGEEELQEAKPLGKKRKVEQNLLEWDESDYLDDGD